MASCPYGGRERSSPSAPRHNARSAGGRSCWTARLPAIYIFGDPRSGALDAAGRTPGLGTILPVSRPTCGKHADWCQYHVIRRDRPPDISTATLNETLRGTERRIPDCTIVQFAVRWVIRDENAALERA